MPATDREPDEAATGRERVHRTAEALGTLKPSEMQCMILKALGYSYDEIAARTGFSWTKVNRSLTEGRRRFFERFGEIAAGTACRRFQPLLSAACDGHAGADDERLLQRTPGGVLGVPGGAARVPVGARPAGRAAAAGGRAALCSTGRACGRGSTTGSPSPPASGRLRSA